MKQKSFSETIVSLSRTVIISSITIFALYSVSAWTGPGSTAPGGNVSGPLTTSATSQIKLGGLNIGGLVTSAFSLSGNGAGAGKVMTSDASGNASWQSSGRAWVTMVECGGSAPCPPGWTEHSVFRVDQPLANCTYEIYRACYKD